MSTRARPRRLAVELLEPRDVPTNFQILSLGTTGVGTASHEGLTGNDRGGIAVSPSRVFVTGDAQTGAFNATDLGNPTGVPGRYDGLVTDLHTQAVYAFGFGAGAASQWDPFFGLTAVDRLLAVDPTTGQLTGAEVPLSQFLVLPFDTGIFSGYDRLLIHPPNGVVYHIDLASGQVDFLSSGLVSPPHQMGDEWAHFGVAERFGGQDYLAYVATVDSVARQRVSDGQLTSLATFIDPTGSYLADMASFTVSPVAGRWYFHHEGASMFRPGAAPGEEVVGFATATFQVGDFLVTNTNDGGPGSLRKAIEDANAAPGPDTIGFATGLTGTINLGSPIPVTDTVTVAGPGSAAVTVAASGASTLLAVSNGVGITLGGLRLHNPDGLTVPYKLTATGDLIASAGTGDVAFTNNLTVAGGTLTVVAGNAADLGPTTIVNGTLAAANGVAVPAGRTLTGPGAVTGNTTVAGTLAGILTVTGNVTVQPGGAVSPVGTFTGGTVTVIGNLTFAPGGTFKAEVFGAGSNDRINVAGTVDLGTTGNPIDLVFPFSYVPSPGDPFLLIDNDATEALGGFLTGPLGQVRNRSGYKVGNTFLQVRYDGVTGNDLELVANTAPNINPSIDTNPAPILEDVPPSSNVGTTIDALVGTGGLYSDAEGPFRSGLAFTALDSTSGAWQFSRDGGQTWAAFGPVSAAAATVLEADGAGKNRIRFQPAVNFFGSAAMSFRAWDTVDGRADGSAGVDTSAGGGNNPFSTETESAAVQVLAVNDPPTPVNDSYTAAEDATLTVPAAGVLANDTDVDGPTPLTAALVSGPAHGTLALNADGSFAYTPAADYAGPDQFTYKAFDGHGEYGVGVVHLTVGPVNDDPTAADDTVVLPEDGGPAPIDVLANDSAAPDAGEALTVSAVGTPAHGTAVISADGKTVIYTPARDYNGTDAFTYTVADGNGGQAGATVNITVTSVNDPPVANKDTATVTEDAGAQPVDVLANDNSGPDAGETVTVVAATNGLHGQVTVVGGVVRYQPDPNYAGPDQFLYTISDGNGGTATAPVELTVVNDAADRLEVITSPTTVTFTETVGGAPQPQFVDDQVQVGIGLEGVLTGATVKFTSGFVARKDTLKFTTFVTPTGTQIRGRFDPVRGVLKLTGSASPADYQAALRTVTYTNPSPAPVDGVRTIAVQVQDAAGVGDPGYRLLRVVGVNTKPVLTLPPTLLPAKYKLGKPAVAVAGPLKIVDVDNTRLQGATVTIGGGLQTGDTLTINKLATGTTSGIAFSYANGVLTLAGNATVATYLKVLKMVKFGATAGPGVNRTIEFRVFDGDLSSDAISRAVTVS